MDKNTKLAIGIGVAAVAGYFIYQYYEGNGHVTSLAASTNPAGSGVADQVMSSGAIQAANTAAVIPPTSADQPDPSQLQALLTWSRLTPNPPLYQQWINGLNASDLNTLYTLFLNYWSTGADQPMSLVLWWNNMRQQYPFLNTSGAGCNNLQCN